MAGTGTTSGLRANRNWRRLWLGQAISLTGDYVFDITVMLWIGTVIAKGLSWAPAAVGGALIAAAVPALVVGPFAGVYVDRWDRRRTMMTADAVRAALITGLLLLPLLGRHLPPGVQVAVIYAVVAAASCFAQFFNPSRLAILGAVVDPTDQPRASGLVQATYSFASIIGPPIAAPLLIVFGVQWALIINAASFAVSFLTLRAIRIPAVARDGEQARASFFQEFREGVSFFAGSRVLMTLAVGVVIATLGTGALNALAVFFVPHNLHVAASWLGTLIGGVGVGAIAGALLTGRVAKRIEPARIFWLGLVLAGVALIGLSRCTLLVAAIGLGVILGVTIGMVNSVITPLMLAATPQHLLGRVVAVINPVQQLASILSIALAGFLASTVLRSLHEVIAGVTFGPYDTVFGVAGLLFIIGGAASVIPLRGAGRPTAQAAGEVEGAGVQDTGPVSPVSPVT
jgi:MFS family permease